MSDIGEANELQNENDEQPVFEFRGTVDSKAYERALRSLQPRRVLIYGAVLLGWILMLLGYSSVRYHIRFFWDVFAEYEFTWVIFGVFFVPYAIYVILVVPNVAKRRFSEAYPEITITHKLYEDRIESEETSANHSGSVSLAYAEVRHRVRVTSQVIVLYRKRRSGITIYKSLIPEADIPKVIAFLRERCSK